MQKQKRIHHDKYTKLRAVFLLSKNVKISKIFEDLNLLSNDTITDSKYCAKLLHKWRKEVFSNIENVYQLQKMMDKYNLEQENENPENFDLEDVLKLID